jgi:hypothetical protein
MEIIKAIVFYTRNIITIITPFIMFFLPKDFFDKGESICLSKLLAGYECYACGLTRSSMYFIHFDFQKSWELNKLTFIVIPMLFALWVKSIYEIQGKKMPGLIGRLS